MQSSISPDTIRIALCALRVAADKCRAARLRARRRGLRDPAAVAKAARDWDSAFLAAREGWAELTARVLHEASDHAWNH